MQGLDTNVLVRFLVGDDPDQASRAASLFARATAEGERFFVAQIVACELVWVLGHARALSSNRVPTG